MNTQVKTAIRFYGPWAAQQEEKWLGQMASQGWQLKNVEFMLYRFVAVQDAGSVYQLDYQRVPKEQWQDYVELFAEAGWEYVTSVTDWHYFRANANNPDLLPLHTNNASKLAMLKRLLTTLLLTGWLPLFYLILFSSDMQASTVSAFGRILTGIAGVVMVTASVLAGYSSLRLIGMIGKLQKEPRE